jgi:hypothetical protein
MALIHSTLPSFYGGVSEQTDEIKLDNQCNIMINCVPSIAQGLQRRNPARIIAEIELLENKGQPYIYTYDRGDRDERYIMLFWSGIWKVFDDNGNLIDEGTDDYLKCSKPSEDLECITVKDTTFIVNKTITTDLLDEPETNIIKTKWYKYQVFVNKVYWSCGPYQETNMLGRLQLTINIDGTDYIETTDDITVIPADCQTDLTSYAQTLFTNIKAQTLLNEDGLIDSIVPHNITVEYSWIGRDTVHEESTGELGETDYGLITYPIRYEYTDDTNWDRDFFYWVKRTDSDYPFTYTIKVDSEVYIGTATANNNSGDLTDSTKSFPTNALIGFTLHNITKNWYGEITSNTATTLFTSENSQGVSINDEYEIILRTTGSDSEVITNTLKNKINNLGDPNYTASTKGSILKVCIGNGSAKMSGYDSWGEQASESWQGSISSINKLPNDLKYIDTVIQITGNANNDYDDYYVKFTEKGNYQECNRPGTSFLPNPDTLPHKLVRGLKVDGITPEFYFYGNDGLVRTDTFGNVLNSETDVWSTRKVGDTNTARDASFIGETITSMFMYRNRLGFLSNDNIILSETNEYYNFYPTTMTDTVDTDVIDVSVDTNQSLKLRYAVNYQKDLLLFGDEEQFILSSQGPLSTKTASVSTSTTYSFNHKAKPESIGPNVYFSVNKDKYSKIREYYIVPDTVSNNATNISEHIPTYIPKNIKKIKGNTKNDVLFFLSEEITNELYVYNFNWNGEDKTQGAWHKWVFKEDICNIEILNNQLIMLFNDGLNYTIKKIQIDIEKLEENISYADHVGTIEGEGEVYSLYDSYFQFSTWGFPTGQIKIDDFRRNLKLKNIEISSNIGSYYNMDVYYKGRNLAINTKQVLNDTKQTNKIRLGGYVKDLTLEIHSIQDKGFTLNSAIMEGIYSAKSKGI